MKTEISSLKLNYNLYPRETLDDYHVARMVEALKSGVSLPPVIADKKTKIVIDGFHRIEAHRSLYGEKSEIPVVYKEYTDIKDMFLDAVRINATQGKVLDQKDLVHCQAIAKSMRIKPDFIASALSVTVENIGKSVSAKITKKIKRLNEERTIDQKKRGKVDRQIYYVRQVISFLEGANYDAENPLLQNDLIRLKFFLNELAI